MPTFVKSKKGYYYKVSNGKKTRISYEEYKEKTNTQKKIGGFVPFNVALRNDLLDMYLKINEQKNPEYTEHLEDDAIWTLIKTDKNPNHYHIYNIKRGVYLRNIDQHNDFGLISACNSVAEASIYVINKNKDRLKNIDNSTHQYLRVHFNPKHHSNHLLNSLIDNYQSN